jgi:hypothetical protein
MTNIINIIITIIIVIIIFLIIKYIYINNQIIEKYNTKNTPILANYLNTNGNTPIIHNTPDTYRDVRSLTLNDFSSSTATFRPCQIHFNNDGTSKYIYEDEWQELDTLISSEDNSEYKVPYKKFSNDNNNVGEFENFNESTKCFKLKNKVDELNTYKYKSNDLIKYKSDSYVEIKYKNFENAVYTDNFMQMNFDKQTDEVSLQKYKEDALDSICSYNYKRDLSLGNIKLYRLTISYPVTNNQNSELSSNTINEGIITAIDHVKIKEIDNSIFIVDDYNTITVDKFPDLLSGENVNYYSIENGYIIFKIDKSETKGDNLNGLNVKIYKFNRNLTCSDQVIKSYEISDVIRLKSHLMIKSVNYISPHINPQDSFPHYATLSDIIIQKLFNDNISSKYIINEGITNDIFNKAVNVVIKNKYDKKSELLNDIKYFIYKLIIICNKDLVIKTGELINKHIDLANQKRIFLDSFNTIQKIINLYKGNTISIEKAKKELLEDIIVKKNITFNEIYIHRWKNVPLIESFVFPYTLDYVNTGGEYEIKIFTSNDKITIPQETICDILIVAGGGGGGGVQGGGGSAGGLIFKQNVNMLPGTYNIIVGKGGYGGNLTSSQKGYNSSFNNITAIGGNVGLYGLYNIGGGGRGSGGTGDNSEGGRGGIGTLNNITGTNIYYAGGGGGGATSSYGRWGGAGGGGMGGSWAEEGSNGKDGFGGGGGGGGGGGNGFGGKAGGRGGSGIVIIRYKKIDFNNKKGELVISNTNNGIIPVKIIMKNKDVNFAINNNNLTLYKNKTYEIDYFSNQTRIREQIEPERTVVTFTAVEKDFEYTNPGNHTFRVPENVTNICILCIGGGGGGNTRTNDGGGGGGGGLMWVNNLKVTPNQDFNIAVGAGGSPGNTGGASIFSNLEIRIDAYGGTSSGNTSSGGIGGSYAASYHKNLQFGGSVGGNGGGGSISFNPPKQYIYDYLAGGGGGAGGYTGKGGNGSVGDYFNANGGKLGEDGTGGGGGGGGRGDTFGAGGGGVGIYGIGSNGNGNRNKKDNIATGGGGGSGGNNGYGINGGAYGGGGGGADYENGGIGGNGVVRIMCTDKRSFPSNAKKNIDNSIQSQKITTIIPAVYNTLATVNGNNIKFTYDYLDENIINFNNARDNKESETILPERKKSENNSNIYKIATKNQPYLKVGILIRNIRNANEQKLGIMFHTHINDITELEEGKDYQILNKSENSNNAEDIIITGYSIIFLKDVSGDIFMKLLNISSTFIYDYTIDPTANFIDIESDYINGNNNSPSLKTILSRNESAIDNYYGITYFDRDRLILYNNRTFLSEDKTTDLLKIQGNPNNNEGIMLTKLQNIYNSLITFNSQHSSRKPIISFLNNVKVSDCIPNVNIDNLTYENPKENQAINYDSSYNIQKISNNYVYFRYPYQ